MEFDFKSFEERNRDLINEILVPIGLLIALGIALWVANG